MRDPSAVRLTAAIAAKTETGGPERLGTIRSQAETQVGEAQSHGQAVQEAKNQGYFKKARFRDRSAWR